MVDRPLDARTDDTIVYEVLQTPRGATAPQVIGRAVYRSGRATVEAPDEFAVAIRELLATSFVDRVESDERPRGYRRTGRGDVGMLVPGMPEHFIARMRGLWLPYPDGSVITAREVGLAGALPEARPSLPEPAEAGPPVTDPAVRRATLQESDEILHVSPIVRANPPAPGLRRPTRPTVNRTDCGWLT